MGGIAVDLLEVFHATTASGTRYEIAYVWEDIDGLELILVASAEPADVVSGKPNTQVSPQPYCVVGCWRGHTYLTTRYFAYETSEESGPACLMVKDKLPDEEEEDDGKKPLPSKVVVTPQLLLDCATYYYTKMREHVHYVYFGLFITILDYCQKNASSFRIPVISLQLTESSR